MLLLRCTPAIDFKALEKKTTHDSVQTTTAMLPLRLSPKPPACPTTHNYEWSSQNFMAPISTVASFTHHTCSHRSSMRLGAAAQKLLLLAKSATDRGAESRSAMSSVLCCTRLATAADTSAQSCTVRAVHCAVALGSVEMVFARSVQTMLWFAYAIAIQLAAGVYIAFEFFTYSCCQNDGRGTFAVVESAEQ
jgi:hypothetical protein